MSCCYNLIIPSYYKSTGKRNQEEWLLCNVTFINWYINFIFPGAFPENGRQRHSLLQRVLAEYYPHAVRDDKTCLQLAEISRSCINYALINPYSFPFTLGKNAVSYFGQITFGFDILNDKSGWQKFTCNIAGKCFYYWFGIEWVTCTAI